jgi:hypothetical protein
MRRGTGLLLAALLATPVPAGAAPLGLAYAVTSGGGALETFDSMGPTGTRAPGVQNGAQWDSYWSVYSQENGGERYANLALDPGMAINAYNGGGASGIDSLDRALGLYTNSSWNPTRYATARFENATGSSLSSFFLQFDAEFWIQRLANRWGGVQAYYSTDNATWTDLGPSFEATFLSPSANTGWVDGNAAANRTALVGGVIDLSARGLASLASGQDFYIRFSMSQGLTRPAGAGVAANPSHVGAFLDNVWVGTTSRPPVPLPIPEPGTAALVAFGLASLARRGRGAESLEDGEGHVRDRHMAGTEASLSSRP